MAQEDYNILVIDDNEDILFMLKSMLKYKGYRVSIKENVENIESRIEALSPDIILMDMLLSGIDGCDICKQIRKDVSLIIPIIMISVYPNAEKKCLEAGANGFLCKPFEMNNLLKQFQRC